jgi:hypothetical protein
MQGITKEAGMASGVQIEPTADSRSAGQEKKVIVQFRHRENRDQSRVPGLSALAVPMLGSPQPAAEPVQQTGAHPVLSPWCEHCVSVRSAELGSSFRIFKDSIGKCWRCFMPLTCDHAVVMHGIMHSCRVRSREIHEIEAINREAQISASYHGE